MIIFINAVKIEVEKRDYTFQEIVELAGLNKSIKSYTMVSTEENRNNSRTYSFNDKIKMKENMRINVDLTINA